MRRADLAWELLLITLGSGCPLEPTGFVIHYRSNGSPGKPGPPAGWVLLTACNVSALPQACGLALPLSQQQTKINCPGLAALPSLQCHHDCVYQNPPGLGWADQNSAKRLPLCISRFGQQRWGQQIWTSRTALSLQYLHSAWASSSLVF